MDNFDKLFQDKLGEITENDFEFKDSSWERFQNGWSEEKETTRGFVPLVWAKRNAAAAAIIVFLLMGNVFFAQQFMSTRTDMKKLTSTVEELRGDIVSCQEKSETHTKAVASLETKVQEQAIVIEEQTELINNHEHQGFPNQNRAGFVPMFPNQNGIVTNNSNSKSNSNGGLNGSNITNNSTENGTLNTSTNGSRNEGNIPNQSTNVVNNTGKVVENQPANNTISNNNTNENPNNSTTNNNTEIANNSTPNTSENSTNEVPKSIDELNRLLLTLNENRASDKVTIKKRPIPVVENDYKIDAATRMNMLAEDAKPSAYQVGVNSMFSYIPVTIPAPTGPVESLPSMIATNNGIIANAIFFKRLRIQVGANYWGQFFEVEDIVNSNSYLPVLIFKSKYPTVEPNNVSDELNKVEIKTYGFDFPINAQILLRPNMKFNPYIGFGVVGRYYNNYKQEYYFLNNSGYEYEVKNEGQPKLFNFGLLQSQVGVDYSITNNWLVNAELNLHYLDGFQNQEFGYPHVWQYGASLGVKYQF